jgi:hypothetical protein
MNASRRAWITGGVLLTVAALLLLMGRSALSDGRKPEVQVQTEYNVGQYQSDTAKAIDMAERVALQNQQTTTVQLARIEAKLDKLAETLSAMDKRLAAIEQRLGIAPSPATPVPADSSQPAKSTRRP